MGVPWEPGASNSVVVLLISTPLSGVQRGRMAGVLMTWSSLGSLGVSVGVLLSYTAVHIERC